MAAEDPRAQGHASRHASAGYGWQNAATSRLAGETRCVTIGDYGVPKWPLWAGAGAAGAGRAGDTRWERRGHDLLVEGPLVVVKERLEDPRAGAEPAEHRALAQARPFGQPVHGQFVRALLGEHLTGRGQQVQPVAGGVGALAARRSQRQDGLVHRPHSTAGILNGVRSVYSHAVAPPARHRTLPGAPALNWRNADEPVPS